MMPHLFNLQSFFFLEFPFDLARRYIGCPFKENDFATQGEQFRVFLHLGKDVPIIAAQNKAIGAESPRVFDFLPHGFFENDLVDEDEVGNDLRTIRFIEKWDFPFSRGTSCRKKPATIRRFPSAAALFSRLQCP